MKPEDPLAAVALLYLANQPDEGIYTDGKIECINPLVSQGMSPRCGSMGFSHTFCYGHFAATRLSSPLAVESRSGEMSVEFDSKSYFEPQRGDIVFFVLAPICVYTVETKPNSWTLKAPNKSFPH
jgi:hypothetical protein